MAIITLKPPTDCLKLPPGKHPVAEKLDSNKRPVGTISNLRLIVRGASRAWEYRFTMPGETVEQYMSLGPYSTANTIHHAIKARDENFELVRQGANPKQARKDTLAEARVARLEAENSPSYRDYVLGLKANVPTNPASYAMMIRYGVDALGDVADMKPAQITFHDLKRAFAANWDKPGVISEMAKYVRRLLALAHEDDLIVDPNWKNPCVLPKLERKLTELPETKHRKAIDEGSIGDLVEALRAGKDGKQHMPYLCVEMAILTGLRSFVVRSMRWEWIDREERLIRIPRAAMKSGMKGVDKSVTHFLIPLTPAMVRVLDRVETLVKPKTFVFASKRSKKFGYLQNTTLLNVLSDLGFRDDEAEKGDRVCTHGYRSAFSNWANAQTKVLTDAAGEPVKIDGEEVIESRWSNVLVDMCLGHVGGKEKVESAYWRSLPPEPRRGIMQAWSAFVEPKAVSLDERRPIPAVGGGPR